MTTCAWHVSFRDRCWIQVEVAEFPREPRQRSDLQFRPLPGQSCEAFLNIRKGVSFKVFGFGFGASCQGGVSEHGEGRVGCSKSFERPGRFTLNHQKVSDQLVCEVS